LQYVSDLKAKEFHYRLSSRSKIDIANIKNEASHYEGVVGIEIRLS
jgi:hypothetical protein